MDEHDLHGASCITGGVIRGRASGNNLNWGDTHGMAFLLCKLDSSIYLIFLDATDVDSASLPQQGKVLLFAS